MKSSVVLAGVASSTMAFAAEPVMAKNQSPHFNAVASQLEMGGLNFSYSDKATTNSFYKDILKMAVVYCDENTPYKGIDADKLADVMTLDAVKASGSSATQRDGFIHHRQFNYMPDGRSMYSMAYGDFAPSNAMKLAPAGADLVLEMHMNGAYDPDIDAKMYAALGPVGEQLKALQAQQAENPVMKQWQELSRKIDSRFVFVADLAPDGFDNPAKLPVHGQLLISADNAQELWNFLKSIPLQPGIEIQTEGNLETLVCPPEVCEWIGWQPLLQFNSETKNLYIATTQQYLEVCQKVKSGASDGLVKDPKFAKLSEGLPETYSNMVYVSPTFTRTVLNFVDMLGMPQVENEEIGPVLRMVMDKAKASDINKTGIVYAASFKDNGTLHVTNGPVNLSELGNPTMVAAVGGVTMSSLFVGAKYYRGNANKAACIINMSSTEKAARSMQNIMGHKEGDQLTWKMLMDGPLGGSKPSCPSGGSYTLSPTYTASNTPVIECSCEGHVLELR